MGVFIAQKGRGKCSSVGFSTVFGHLIAGEERFSVEFREEDSTVWLDLYSISKGAGVLGKVRSLISHRPYIYY